MTDRDEVHVVSVRDNQPLPEGWTVHLGDHCVYHRQGSTVATKPIQQGINDMIEALRQRAEAAEAELNRAMCQIASMDAEADRRHERHIGAMDEMQRQAWNAAIEAAAKVAETTPDEIVGTMELTPSQYVVADAIRARRRPAKTAGGDA